MHLLLGTGAGPGKVTLTLVGQSEFLLGTTTSQVKSF
jgi:hypothetical protein